MENKAILILVFSFITCILSAQTNISVDNYCLRENVATFSQSLIDLKGEKFVSNLLEDNVSFSIFCDVDSSGIIIDFKKVRSNKELSKELEHEIMSYLKTNRISFYICYEKPPGVTNKEAYDLIKKDLFDKNQITHLININFPGDLMSLYVYESDKVKEQGLTLSKYDYFISMMNKYESEQKKDCIN